MKVRVIFDDNTYYSQYYNEDKKSWQRTYIDKTWLSVQNAFDTKEDAILECRKFVERFKSNIIWEAEL